MGTINVAIIGVGNCASSLIQGVYKYKGLKEKDKVPGIMHPVMGGYSIEDINFVAAFDVDKNKVGTDISDAIFAEPIILLNSKKYLSLELKFKEA